MPPPVQTHAQEAATRVYDRGGILVRSDPHIKAADRFGKSFQPTQWYEPPAPTPARAGAGSAAGSGSGGRQRPQPVGPVERLRRRIIERSGAAGIHMLGRSFQVMDHDHSSRLDAQELRIGLQHYGLDMSHHDLEELIVAMDKDGSGSILFGEFLVALRGPLNSRRLRLIDMAFQVMDQTRDGRLNVDDLLDRYSVDHDPDVMAGRISREDAYTQFLNHFEVGPEHDGMITKQEFVEYYKNVSASVDDDDYFELMIRNAWHIPGGEGVCANTANTRVLVIFKDGSQKVVMIVNDLGLDLSNQAAVVHALEAQGVTNIARCTLSGDV